jgi:hypothetical protein
MRHGNARNSYLPLRITKEEREELNDMAREIGTRPSSLAYMLYRRGLDIERKARARQVSHERAR